jgi:hypothetical protein
MIKGCKKAKQKLKIINFKGVESWLFKKNLYKFLVAKNEIRSTKTEINKATTVKLSML